MSSNPSFFLPDQALDVLRNAKRIVIKIGSHLLVPSMNVRKQWVSSVVADIIAMMGKGQEVLLVSSGAVALGRSIIKPSSNIKLLSEQQSLAAIGQVSLMALWKDAFQQHQKHVAQCLLTTEDTEQRHRYINARDTLSFLFSQGAVPIVNENDTISTEEIRYGDNDRLAARVAVMVEAQALVILSDIKGLHKIKNGELTQDIITKVATITPEIRSMVIDNQKGKSISKGGMSSKLDAAHIATRCGCHTFIISGVPNRPIANLLKNKIGTWFPAPQTSLRARKKWLSSSLQTKGAITIDDGAKKALQIGSSLLSSGIIQQEGDFQRGDITLLIGKDGQHIALGLVAYGHKEVAQMIGIKSCDIISHLGYSRGNAIIHRDNISLLSPSPHPNNL